MVGIDDLDRHIKHLAAEILNRHLGGFDGGLAAEIGIDARLIVQDTDLDLAVGRALREHRSAARKQKCN